MDPAVFQCKEHYSMYHCKGERLTRDKLKEERSKLKQLRSNFNSDNDFAAVCLQVQDEVRVMASL